MNVLKHIMQRSWTVLLALAAALVLLTHAPQARAEVFYGIPTDGTGIYSVDTVTGGPATRVFPFTVATTTGYTLATRPSDGMLFYIDTNGANPNLWRWDPANPATPPVLVGGAAGLQGATRLGFDAVGNLYSMNSGVGTELWKLDPNTSGILSITPLSGAFTPASDVPQGGDLCLQGTTGDLYMVIASALYTITPAGVVTLKGTMSNLGTGSSGCAFDRFGNLVVSTATAGELRRVNLSTLATTAMPISTGVAAFYDLGTSPGRTADLSVTKTASNATPGNLVSFTVSVSNAGPDRATDVRVLDLLPAGLTLVSAIPSQGSYSATAVGASPNLYPAGTWRVGTLNNGAAATLTINASVTTGTTPITNTAQVSYVDQYDPNSSPNNNAAGEDDQASVTITPSPDLQVLKTATSTFAVGANATYAITVNNTLGSRTTSGVYTVTDVLPAGLTFVSATGTNWSCGALGQTVTCTSSTAITTSGGASTTNPIVLTVKPDATAVPSVSNTATVSGGGEPASNNGNNSSTISTPVCVAGGCPDLVVNKTLSTASLTVGINTSVYTLSVSNIGGLPSNGSYTLSDTLPTGLMLAAVPTAGAGWACTVGAIGGTQVTCNRSTVIAPGGTSTTITFPVNVLNTAAPGVINTASVSDGGEPPSTTGNNSTSLTTPVIDFDLTVTKTKTTTANFVLGVNTATYTLTVNNMGGRASTGTYTVTDTLPAGLTLNAVPTAAGWTCTANSPLTGDNVVGGGRVVCSRSTVINAGAAAASSIVFPVRVGPLAAPSVSNTATVSNPDEAPALTGNNASTITNLVNAPDLVIAKSHNGDFTVGVNADYTLRVSNAGALTTGGVNVIVTDTLPVGIQYVSFTGTGWSCAAVPPAPPAPPAVQVVTCQSTTAITAYPAATSSAQPLTLKVKPTSAAVSPVTNNASVAGGNEPAGNAGNNSAADIANVYYPPPVITKSFSPASFQAGTLSTLTFTITNPAGNPASLAGLAVVDPFPAGMTVASGSVLTNTCGGTVLGSTQGDAQLTLTGGSTGAGGTSCTMTLQVTSTTVGAQTNTTGQVSSSNGGTGNAASANFTVTAPGSPQLRKTSSPNPVGVNQPSTLTFTITNKTTTTNNMGFTDTLPSGVVVSSPATFGGSCASNTNPALSRTATAGGNTITVAGVDLAGSATCTVTINVQSATAGSYANTNGNISNLAAGLVATGLSDTLVVQRTTLTKAFAPSTIAVNATSLMTFTIANGVDAPGQNGLAFTETLPAGVTVAVVPNATQCSGTVVATVGAGTIAFSGGALASSQTSCTIAVSVTSASAGTYSNQTSNVTGVSANILNNATASLIVVGPLPSLLFMKTVAVTSDPVNGTTNQKNIPGAEVLYTLRVTNTGPGTVDNNSLSITDPIPAGTELFVGDLGGVGSGPILFAQGSPSSNLSWAYTAASPASDDVEFYNGVTWAYVPTPPYDPAVTHIRLNPKGTMAGANAFFDLSFRVRIK